MPDVEAAASSAKKRGRTPKSPAPAAASEESGEPVVKRGRGRPKGSKSTKKKQAAPKPTGPKRPRGRPKGSVKKKPEATDKSATPKKSPKKASEWRKFLSFAPERLQPLYLRRQDMETVTWYIFIHQLYLWYFLHWIHTYLI